MYLCIRMKRSFADILEGIERKQEKKIETKLPEWSSVDGIMVPDKLSLEQCSSSRSSGYKADLVRRLGARSIVDITGGLGVDSWAFSKVAGHVFYFERKEELCKAAEKNFAALGSDNITVQWKTIGPESELPACDLVYADPARRVEGNSARKLYRLEDCTPDILTLLPTLWKRTDRILLKLSPMADIAMLSVSLGKELKEIHVTGLEGECKELLCLLVKGNTDGFRIFVKDLDSGKGLSFLPEEESSSAAKFASPVPGELLFEPSAVLMKAGCFKLMCSRFGLKKFAPSTNLYCCESLPSELTGLGKTFTIKELLPLNNATLREVAKRFPNSEITARNIPVSSEELKKKMGLRSGSDAHIFACTILENRMLIIT